MCVGLLVGFAVASLAAANTQSATYDEHFHLLGAYANLWLFDYRVDFDNFTLWGYWAALGIGPDGVRLDSQNPYWPVLLQDNNRVRNFWAVLTHYHTPGNDIESMLRRARPMMAALGVMLGAVVARWAYEIAGPAAAVVATILFAFDPNFLGHAPLIKNDVGISLAFVLAGYATWRVGRRLTWLNVACLCVACAAAANVKATGILAGPIAVLLLGVRVAIPAAWPSTVARLTTRPRKLAAVGAVSCLIVAIGYFGIWACYGFRYGATPVEGERIDIAAIERFDRVSRYAGRTGLVLPSSAPDTILPAAGATVRLASWSIRRGLLPEAYLAGMAYASAELQFRAYFLRGSVRSDGWWYYFPLASLFKLPTATLVAAALLTAAWIRTLCSSTVGTGRPSGIDLWSVACLLIPSGILCTLAMASGVNLGVRHIFPVYVFGFITLGVGAARLGNWRAPLHRIAVAVLTMGLAIESALTYPDYISFFNAPSGGASGGLTLLADSNLDWGQDLKKLAQWAHDHPSDQIYLSWLSLADPDYYKLRYCPAFAGVSNRPAPAGAPGPGILAIDANSLQGMFVTPHVRRSMRQIKNWQLVDRVGGTIYLYRIPAETNPSTHDQ